MIIGFTLAKLWYPINVHFNKHSIVKNQAQLRGPYTHTHNQARCYWIFVIINRNLSHDCALPFFYVIESPIFKQHSDFICALGFSHWNFFYNLRSLFNNFPRTWSQYHLCIIPRVKSSACESMLLYFNSFSFWILCWTQEEMVFFLVLHVLVAPSEFALGYEGGDSVVWL